jgi:hypothetical protein
MIAKYKKKILKIKDISAEFFNKIEKASVKNSKTIDAIEKTVDQWRGTVIKPTQVAEARLFGIETMLAEGENERIAEYEFLKDIVKKLVIALEANNVKHVSQLGSPFSKDGIKTPMLKILSPSDTDD